MIPNIILSTFIGVIWPAWNLHDMLPPMDYQGPRILPFDVMVNSHLITTSKLSSTTGMCKKPLVRLPMQSSPLSSTSPEDSRSSKLLANDNQVVFPSRTWGFIPNCLDLSISEKSLAWLFIPNCWWVNVAPFPETSEGPGLTCPGEPPSWVATTYINRGWIEPRN